MIVCHASPSEVSGRFIGTTNTIGTIGSGGSNGTTSLDTFLFQTIGSGILVAFGDYDLLRRL